MNKQIILSMFSKMFPNTEAIEINLTDEVITTLSNGERKDFPLEKNKVIDHVSLLKDYLNIKDNINNIVINIKDHSVQVFHSNGSKLL